MTRIGERSESTGRGIDRLVECARSAEVDRAAAERYVAELDRWARPAPPARRWVPWLAGGLAAAVALLALWWRGGAALERPAPVQIGDRVAIVAAPGAVYRVMRADPGGTEIAVDRGAVTARLWRSAEPHRLVLSGGGITATATGTVYTLAIAATGPVVRVTEGTVEVRAADGLHVVAAGASWPAADPGPDPDGARTLLALSAPVPRPGPADADAAVAADAAIEADAGGSPASPDGADSVEVSPGPRRAPAPPRAASGPPAMKDRWRTARLLRGQGRFAAAIAECVAIADARDSTWSPIALIEALRIELGPLAEPEGAIALADRMLREWPGDPLLPEARELRCRALRQLGRAAECASPRP